MSHDVYLRSATGESLEVPNHQEGGTQMIGGTTDAWLNVTYNYSKHIWKYSPEEGLKQLNGKKARDVEETLRKAVKELGTERVDDYWEASEGNVGYALSILLSWCAIHPDGIFEVS